MSGESLRNEILLEAAGSSGFEIEAFGRVFAKHLEDSERVFDINVIALNCKGPRGKKLEILGYAEDPTDESLTLLVGKYFGGDSTLGVTEAKEALRRATGFLECAVDGWLSKHLEASSQEMDVAEYFRARVQKNLVSKVRVMLLTDGVMSDRLRTIESEVVAGLKVVYEIWDQKRLLEADIPAIGSEDIRVDFTRWLPGGLPCLVATTSNLATRTLLAVIPASIVAAVFEEYGSLLLESNVRTFLSARGAVNKGIQATLAHEPSKFLAYNNGLTTTATNVELSDTPAGRAILSIDRWQIVNGGQTTASIAHYLRGGNSRSVDDVDVQMKLVIVDETDASFVVQSVAKYANSQNKVSTADLFATHEFHVRLEKISRRLRAPAAEGMQYQTGWYYERARGQWENDKVARGTVAAQKKYEMEYPKRQKITKTDWAKYAYCWEQKPHVVSKGAQSVFADFAVSIDKVWDKQDENFNEGYFRNGVAQLIIYEDLKAQVLRSDWYKASVGYLANIVAYAISRFTLGVKVKWPANDFDLAKVWQKQSASDITQSCLLAIAAQAQAHLTNPGRPQANVTQWAKQQACWEGFSNVSIVLPQSLERDLIGSKEVRKTELAQRQIRKIDSGFEAVKRILATSSEVWDLVVRNSKHVGVSPLEQDLIWLFAGSNKVPSDKQARALLQAFDRFVVEGVLKADSY